MALCAYEISRRTRIFHEFAFNDKALKTFVEFRICSRSFKVTDLGTYRKIVCDSY